MTNKVAIRRRSRAALLASTALSAVVLLVLAPLPAEAQVPPVLAPNARPQGGQVVAGGAQISTTASATNIDQSTQRAAINWQSFSVGSQQSVNFHQPNSSAIALNRVVGPDPSAIAGHINANGQVVLINQSGVVFMPGAQVNAQSVVVSTANITNQDFMAGHMNFSQPGNPNARIVNQGTITVKQTGLAALVAPQVANSGLIQAKLGHVVLAGVKTTTLDLYGDGLLSLDVSNQVTQVPTGPGGKSATALVTNSGTILADGGTVDLTAKAADGLVQNLVTDSGRVRANSVGAHPGTIVIGGIGGSVEISGQLSATGLAAGQTGGQIGVNASGGVVLTNTARLNASGAAGGGTVALGLPLGAAATTAGTATLSHAVLIDKGARVAADATQRGNGGRITVQSAQGTGIAGTLTARGGPQGGNGGTVEMSSHGILALDGYSDVSAPAGSIGSILLDPFNLDIVGSDSAQGTAALDTNFTSASGTLSFTVGGTTSGTSYLQASTIDAQTGNVIIQAANNLDVQSSVSIVGSITLQAGNDLTVDSSVSVAGARVQLFAGDSSVTGTGSAGSSGRLTVDGTVSGTGVVLSAGTNGITEGSSGAILATGLSGSGTTIGDVQLGSTLNNVGTLGNFTTDGSFALTNGGPATVTNANLVVDGLVSAADISLQIPGTGIHAGSIRMTNAGTLDAGTGTLNLFTNAGSIAQASSASLIGGTLTSGGSVNGLSVSLNGQNTLTTLYNFYSGGGMSISNTTGLTVLGRVQDNAGVTLNAGGDLLIGNATTGGTLSSNTAAMSLTATGSISENSSRPEVLAAGTLSGTATGGVLLGSTRNTVGTLGAFTSGGNFTLASAGDLGVAGSVSAKNIYLHAIKAGTVDGSINMINTGTLDAGNGTGTIGLVSTNGSVSQTASASLVGGTLTTGGKVIGNGMTLTGTNTLGALYDVLSSGGLSISNAIGLTILGRVQDNTGVTLNAGGSLLIGNATTSGTLSSNTATMSLIANGGSIAENSSQPEVLAAGTLNGSATGDVQLGSTANAVATLGTFASGGTLAFTNGAALAAVGPVSGSSVVLRAPTLSVNGLVHATSASAPLIALGADTLNVGGAGTLNAGTGTVALMPFTSTYGIALGGTHAGDLSISDVTALETHLTASTLDFGLPGTLAGGPIDLLSPVTFAGTLGLFTQGTIGQIGSAGLDAGVLQGQAGGAVALNSTLNSIATLGDFGVINNTLSLTDGSGLIISGTVGATDMALQTNATTAGISLVAGSALDAPTGTLALGTAAGGVSEDQNATIRAGTLASLGTGVTGAMALAGTANDILSLGALSVSGGNLAITDAGSLTVAGIVQAPNIALDSAGDMTLSSGGLSAASGTVGLLSTGGSITETPSFALSAGTLTSDGGTIGGGAMLTGTANAVGTLANFAAAGTVSVADGSMLSVGSVVRGSSVLLSDSSTGGIRLMGLVQAAAGGLVALASNALYFGLGSSLATPGGTVTLGPLSANYGISLGGSPGAGTLALAADALSHVNTGGSGTLRLAPTGGDLAIDTGVTLAGGSTIASTLDIAGAGTVSEGGVGSLDIGTLSGTAKAFALNNANSIATLGALAATSGGISLRDDEALAIAGTVAVPLAQAIALSSDNAITFAGGALDAPAGVVQIAPILTGTNVAIGTTSGTGLVISSLDPIVADTVRIGSSTTPAGEILFAAPATLAGTLSLDSDSLITQTSAGSITAAALSAAAGSGIALGSTGNAIGVLGSLNAGNGALRLADSSSITTTGSITAGGNIALIDSNPGGVTLGGTISSPFSSMISLVGDRLDLHLGAISIPFGTVELARYSPGASTVGSTGNIVLPPAGGITAAELRIGADSVGGPLAITAQSLDIAGTLSAPGAVVELDSLGTIGQTAPIDALRVTGSANGNVTLANTANSIGGLGNFQTGAGTFDLTDSAALSVTGNVSAQAVRLTDSDIAAFDTPITVGGTISAGSLSRIALIGNSIVLAPGGALAVPGGTVELTPYQQNAAFVLGGAGSGFPVSSLGAITAATLQIGGAGTPTDPQPGAIGINGSLVFAGTLSLNSNGPITQTAPIDVGTLVGTTTGSASLGSANTITTLGSFTTGGLFDLTNNTPLLVGGTIAGQDITISNTGAVNLASGGGLVTGVGGTLALATSAGGIAEQAGFTIAAGTLTSDGLATFGGLMLALGGNTIGSLGAIDSVGDFSLTNASSLLAVNGFVQGGNITLDNAGAITLASGGLVTGAGGTLALATSAGGIAEAAGFTIAAGTLTSDGATAVGGIDLALGGNTIGSLGAIASTGGFSLVNTGSLDVAGSV
ncbi:MAG TPA: filamentous hemagglutinin N-terminal domain-containing protein, partial [Acetobacteraceae bacterium]|nr:filamentous hemagglutinin N-terminal domain-containing protein [Acetobacteraceae bacterium]